MSNMKEVATQLCDEQRKMKAMEREFGVQKKICDGLRQQMIAEMQIAGTTSYNGEGGTLSVRKSQQAVVDDWPAFYKFIHENEAFDLLQRRIAVTSYRERIEDGPIPGTSEFEKSTLFITLK